MQVAQVPSLVRELGSHVPQLRVHMSQLKRSRVSQIEKKKKILNATAMTQCSQINKFKKLLGMEFYLRGRM